MLVGWLLLEAALVVVSVGMMWPRLAIRVPRRLRFGRWKNPTPPRSRRRAVIEATIGVVLIALILSDWSGLRFAWQGARVAVKTSGTLAGDRAKLADDIVTPPIRSGEQMGVVVGVVDNGVTWTRGYGRKSTCDAEPPDGGSVFEIGSVTKTFTCIALAAMCQSGDAKLTDPIGKYFPDGVRVPSYRGRQITLEDLATQTSGLPRLPDNMGILSDFSGDPYANYTADDCFTFLNKCKLTRAPGSKYEYSNFGMGLLGLALSRKIGKPYEQMVVDLVCKPLGMCDTSTALSRSQKERLVQGHALQSKVGGLLIGVPADNWTMQDCFAGAGALKSTANDMLKYLQANIEPGGTSLGPALAMTHKIRHGSDEDLIKVCLGWHTFKVPWSKEPIIWHNGGTGGYCSFIGFCPKRKLGVVVLGNTAGDVDVIAMRIMKALLLSEHKH